MCVHNSESKTSASNLSIEARIERTLWRPQAKRLTPHKVPECLFPELKLRSNPLVGWQKPWKKSVRRRTAEKLKVSLVCKASKRPNDIAAKCIPLVFGGAKMIRIKTSKWRKCSIPIDPHFFPFREMDLILEIRLVALLKCIVREHRKQGRGETHRQLERNAVPPQAIKCRKKRQITLCDRLEQPALFERSFVFEMPYERKVRVQNERKVAFKVQQRSSASVGAPMDRVPFGQFALKLMRLFAAP